MVITPLDYQKTQLFSDRSTCLHPAKLIFIAQSQKNKILIIYKNRWLRTKALVLEFFLYNMPCCRSSNQPTTLLLCQTCFDMILYSRTNFHNKKTVSIALLKKYQVENFCELEGDQVFIFFLTPLLYNNAIFGIFDAQAVLV